MPRSTDRGMAQPALRKCLSSWPLLTLTQGRGLKPLTSSNRLAIAGSPLTQGRGLKLGLVNTTRRSRSPLSQGRGLKHRQGGPEVISYIALTQGRD